MGTWCTAGLLLLLAGASFSVALAPNSIHRLLDFTVPEDEDVEAPRRSVRAANPESFADYFRKLQLAQSELSKNASVGEAEIEKVFKSHGLEIGNDTHDENGTATTIGTTGSSSIEQSTEIKSTSGSTEYPTTIAADKPKKVPCHAASGTCADLAGTTTKPVKKYTLKHGKTESTAASTANLPTSTASPEDSDENSTATTTEPDSTDSPSSTTSYSSGAWWGVSRKSKPMHLKSTIARQVVNKIKTSRRRTHFD